MRVLIVEDDKKIGGFIQQGFRQEGGFVELLEDGAEALEILKSSPFDLIILDRMIPSLDGLSVLKRIRELKISTPTIILSAQSALKERVEGR